MYCTQCGRTLPRSGICPRCAKTQTISAVHPMGQTVYSFAEGGAFLILCLIWTLSTVWTGVLLFFSSRLATIFLLPSVLLCVGLWMTYGCAQPRQKRIGLSLASGSVLTVSGILAVFLAAISLVSLYGVFLSTTDSESYDTIFSYFKLVGALFVFLFASLLYLNRLRKVLRTAHGVLRGNRGMAVCPLLTGLFSIVCGAAYLFLAFATSGRITALSLLHHALDRLPSTFDPAATPLANLDWTWLAPSLIGSAVALMVTGVILILYWQVLRQAKAEILHRGGLGKGKSVPRSVSDETEGADTPAVITTAQGE